MGSLFKTKVITNSASRISAFAVNQSSYGVPIKVVFGTTVVAPVLIDYVDFTAIKHVETQQAGKGGKTKSENVSYTYTVAVDMALAEGVCTGVGKVYSDSKTTDLDALGLTFFNGYMGGYQKEADPIFATLKMYTQGEQSPWGYMVTKHPDHALSYSGICHVAGVVDLGSSSSLPNLNFELGGLCTSAQGEPSNEKMQQFAYQKTIEISNFKSNIMVQEFVFDSLSGSGGWETLNGRYYTITQSTDQYGNPKAGVYTYTFNFDDRDDGYYRADPIYIRIYYYAIEANVSFTPTDANPSDIITYLLQSDVFGEQFPLGLIGDFSEYSTYCKNNGLLISPVYDSSTACTDIINQLMECTNSEYVFSQGKVKIVPYWDALPASYAITDKDIFDQDSDSISIERTSDADIYNIIPLEHTSRANDYNVSMVYATNEGDIEINGIRQAGTYTHHEIMTPQLAQAVAQMILQKQLYNRNKYTIRVGQEFILLEPMDACTLELELVNMGLTTVRVVSIKENADDLSLDITFEDNFSGLYTAPTYDVQLSDSAVPVTNTEAGNINYPAIFEVPKELAKSVNGLDVWIYASGSSSYWGGCNVWVSEDGNSYLQIGTISNPAVQGNLITDLPYAQDVDTTNTPLVKLVAGELKSTTKDNADSFATLSYIDGEFIAYQNAELTGVNTYELSYIRRGAYGSPILNHSSGEYFVRCDNTRLVYNFSENNIGKTYYVKFTSFNIFGDNEQLLSEVEPYTFTLRGIAINYYPNPVTNVVSYQTDNKTYIEWQAVKDDRDIYYAIFKGDNWDNAVQISTTNDTTTQVTSSGTYWIVTAYDGTDKTYYATPVSVEINYDSSQTIIGSCEESEYGWTGECTDTIVIL